MKIKMDHVNLTVNNLNDSRKWYESVFEMTLLEHGTTWDERPWAIMGRDGTMICMTEKSLPDKSENFDESAPHAINHFGIRVDNEDAWRKIVEKMQLKLYYGGINEYPHSRSWYVKDPTGHTIEVSYSGGKPLRFD